MYDEKFDEPAALADVFNFKSTKLSSSTKYVCKYMWYGPSLHDSIGNI